MGTADHPVPVLLHKRRVTEDMARGNVPAAVCEDCLEAFSSSKPWLCKFALANDLWLGRPDPLLWKANITHDMCLALARTVATKVVLRAEFYSRSLCMLPAHLRWASPHKKRQLKHRSACKAASSAVHIRHLHCGRPRRNLLSQIGEKRSPTNCRTCCWSLSEPRLRHSYIFIVRNLLSKQKHFEQRILSTAVACLTSIVSFWPSGSEMRTTSLP